MSAAPSGDLAPCPTKIKIKLKRPTESDSMQASSTLTKELTGQTKATKLNAETDSNLSADGDASPYSESEVDETEWKRKFAERKREAEDLEDVNNLNNNKLEIPDWDTIMQHPNFNPKLPVRQWGAHAYSLGLAKQLMVVKFMINNAWQSQTLVRKWQKMGRAIAKEGKKIQSKKYANKPGSLWIEYPDDEQNENTDSGDEDDEDTNEAVSEDASNRRATKPSVDKSPTPGDESPASESCETSNTFLAKLKRVSALSIKSSRPATNTTTTTTSAPLACTRKRIVIPDHSEQGSELPQRSSRSTTHPATHSAPLAQTKKRMNSLELAPESASAPKKGRTCAKLHEVSEAIRTILVVSEFHSTFPLAQPGNRIFLALHEPSGTSLFRQDPEERALDLQRNLDLWLPDNDLENTIQLGEYGLNAVILYIEKFRNDPFWPVEGEQRLLPKLSRISEFPTPSTHSDQPVRNSNMTHEEPTNKMTTTAPDHPPNLNTSLNNIDHVEPQSMVVPSTLSAPVINVSPMDSTTNTVELLRVWKDPEHPKIDIRCSSVTFKKETVKDCMLMHEACKRLLLGRLSASFTSYDPNERSKGSERLYFSKHVKLSEWVALKQNDGLFHPGCECPWFKDEILDWNYIDFKSGENPSSDVQEKSLCYTLNHMQNVKKSRMETAGKFILAAVGLVGTEGGPIEPIADLEHYNLSQLDVKESFQCAVHYQKLQMDNNSNNNHIQTVEMNCIKQLTKLVDSIYGCIEALAVIRAHNFHYKCNEKLQGKQKGMDATFRQVSSTVGLRTQALAPLVSFLCLGFKGLLTYWRDPSRTYKTGLIQVLLVTARMKSYDFVEEPIWKRTANLVMTTISRALFPNGNIDNGVDRSSWDRVICKRQDVALAMYLDVSDFFQYSSVSDSLIPPYMVPVYEALAPDETDPHE
ncbi:uncharacterized protein MELLADRAFT_92311 [Melampsora larici-populina 98AG31]|uniref:Uncharacterized protein n=1 Tax=Melampsora larici-populina (strain 98AG31 / pathotype 3-4-7) TaxID=747676 RepID=F4R958_MELLP|nr:uncharacterized protein MELLADRAFT_92311 [Melampsora larici-populina 98AG31]EGG11210.1 hypothetical protein MELLADRAFT_92311 [Melampsora larici-populina 98AG31]